MFPSWTTILPPIENETTVNDQATGDPPIEEEDTNECMETDMDCDSGSEANESELGVVNLAEPTDSELAANAKPSDRPNSIVKAISFFLFFFQLKYRVPDRAISLLLLFVKGLVHAIISLVTSCSALSSIYQSVPQSLKSLGQTVTSGMNGVTEYVVCPKGSTLSV